MGHAVYTVLKFLYYCITLSFSLEECMELNNTLRTDISKCIMREKELENVNQTLKDEHQALQLAFSSLEEKLRKAQVYLIFISITSRS